MIIIQWVNQYLSFLTALSNSKHPSRKEFRLFLYNVEYQKRKLVIYILNSAYAVNKL